MPNIYTLRMQVEVTDLWEVLGFDYDDGKSKKIWPEYM